MEALKRLFKRLELAVKTVVSSFFSLLFRLADVRKGAPFILRKVVQIGLVSAIASAAGWWGLNSATPDWYPKSLESGPWTSWAVVFAGLLGLVATFCSFIVFNGVLPLLIYIPHAVSMQMMGLKQGTVEQGSVGKIVSRFAKEHESQTADGHLTPAIRVICISGKNLFQSLENGEAPLYHASKEGRLEVLMPACDKSNPTLEARYDSYAPEFKKTNYAKIQALVAEVSNSKTFLKATGNKVWEHNTLCMWRVVLFSRHCVVQNYFPNHRGMQSDHSPVFVFEKGEGADFSYYQTFEQMFELLKRRSKKLK